MELPAEVFGSRATGRVRVGGPEPVPAELADGRDGPPLEVDALREVEHAGRPAWEALVERRRRRQARERR